jgi:hypothetical protein
MLQRTQLAQVKNIPLYTVLLQYKVEKKLHIHTYANAFCAMAKLEEIFIFRPLSYFPNLLAQEYCVYILQQPIPSRSDVQYLQQRMFHPKRLNA